MSNLNPQTTELLLAAAVAFAMLIQAIVVLALFFVLRKTIRIVHGQFEETRVKVNALIDKAHPIIDNAQDIVAKSKPKIESVMSDVVVMTQKLRSESDNVQATTRDLVDRVRTQGKRVDTMMTRTLDSVDRAAGFVTDAMGKPMRQLSAILASAKAVIESLRNTAHDGRGPMEPIGKVSKEADYYDNRL